MGSYLTTETCIIPGITACGKLLCFIHTKRREKKQKEKDKKELYNRIHKTINDNLDKKLLLTRRRSSKVLLPPILKNT